MRVPIPPTALVAILLMALCVLGPVSAIAETQIAAVPSPSPERAVMPRSKPTRMDPSRPCGGERLLPYRQSGRAHYYGPRHQGQRTANGETFDMEAKTAAHLSLPFGTRVRVTNVSNGRSVVVRINDRHARRTTKIIDLSRGAADDLGFRRKGVTTVRLQAVCQQR
jgi:rare lipoprotein A